MELRGRQAGGQPCPGPPVTQDGDKTHSVGVQCNMPYYASHRQEVFPGVTLKDKTPTGLDVKQNDPQDAQQPPHPCLFLLLPKPTPLRPSQRSCQRARHPHRKEEKAHRRRQAPRQRTEGDSANTSHGQGTGWDPQVPSHGHDLMKDWQVTICSPSSGTVAPFLKL